MQNAVSRQKQLSVVFVVANAQKQGAEAAECIEAEYATMFQELVQNAECKIYSLKRQKERFCNVKLAKPLFYMKLCMIVQSHT